MAQTDAVIRFTVGVPGSGKTYSRVRWLIEHFIPNENGDIYTNLPLNKEKIISYFVHEKGYDPHILESRINIFPADLLKQWKYLDSEGLPPTNPDYNHINKSRTEENFSYKEIKYEFIGPWLYLQDKNLTGAHIQFDEIQKLVDIKATRKLKQIWGDWLSTIRHEGCTVEFITQREARVPKEISQIAETRLDIIPNGGKRFKYLPILNSDYYNLYKGLLGIDTKSSTEIESRASYGGKVVIEFSRKFRFNPFFFQFYNTANNEESDKKTERKKEPWELYSQIGIVQWFIKRNWFYLLLLVFYTYIFYLIVSFQGIKTLQKKTIEFFSGTEEDKMKALAKNKGLSLEQYKKQLLIDEIKQELKKEQPKEITANEPFTKISENHYVFNSPPDNKKLSPEAFYPLLDPEEQKEIALERKKSEFSIVFIPESQEYAILKNKLMIKKGTTFTSGIYKGLQVLEISFNERKVFLTNDEVLYFE